MPRYEGKQFPNTLLCNPLHVTNVRRWTHKAEASYLYVCKYLQVLSNDTWDPSLGCDKDTSCIIHVDLLPPKAKNMFSKSIYETVAGQREEPKTGSFFSPGSHLTFEGGWKTS